MVSAEGHVACGRCRNCLAGRRHLCKDTKGIGVNRTSAFAEYISVPMRNVWHHKPDIDRDVASISDPFGNAVHTALSFVLLMFGLSVAGGAVVCALGWKLLADVPKPTDAALDATHAKAIALGRAFTLAAG